MTAETPRLDPAARSGLERFESLRHLEGKKFASIESVARLFAALGNPQDAVPSVHVAGTNGKGSVCTLIAAMLHCSGARVGQTSSPHLSSVTERCLIDGRPVDEREFGSTVQEVCAVADREQVVPSYFVLGISAAFCEFSRRDLDWAVVEVGIGGELDATNLIHCPAVSVITGVSIDHTDILGADILEIARNKAGIAKHGVPMFVGLVSDDVREEIARIAAIAGAPVEFFGRDFDLDFATDELVIGTQRVPAFTRRIALAGFHQRRNAALAARVAYHLGVSSESVGEGARRARWPGRLELFPGEPPVLLDVAHNVEGIESLCNFLGARAERRIVLVLSILQRKDWRAMIDRCIEVLAEKELEFVFTDSGYASAVCPDELRAHAGRGRAIVAPEAALEAARSAAGSNGIVVVSGSVFLVGWLRRLLSAEPISTIA